MSPRRRLLWRVARALGDAGARWSWNDQFRSGYWDTLRNRRGTVASLVEQLAGGGDIVELGCGEGVLIESVDPDAYRTYVGVDLSRVAIDAATRRARQAGLEKCRFEVGRFEQCPHLADASLVIMEESLYYLKPRRQRRLLRRCLGRLNAGGRIVVAVHCATRHRSTLASCRRAAVVEREIRESDRVILTLRARDEAGPCVCRVMGVPAPRYRGMPMFRHWWSGLSWHEKAGATVGTVRRVRRRKLRARVTVS